MRPYQVASSDVSMVEMVDKLWLRTGDDALVKEFYDAVKRTTIHTMNLRPDYGEKQVISMPTGDKDSEWVEFVPLYGLVSHVGGLHLAQLRMAKRMAEKIGDAEFAKQCDQWFEAGSKALEEDLWAGTHYLLYHEFKSGKKSDVLMGCQLDGEWIAQFHGLPGVFRPDRVKTTLDTIAKANADPKRCPYGMRVFANADGSKAQGDFSYWGDAGTFSSEGFMLGMTYLYNGQRAFGEDVIRRTLALRDGPQRLHLGLPAGLGSRQRQARLRLRLLPEHDALVRAGGHGRPRPLGSLQTRRTGRPDPQSGRQVANGLWSVPAAKP